MGCRPIDRKKELARIHILKEELDMAEAEYRDMLWSVSQGQGRSAADLDWRGRRLVIDHLVGLKQRYQARSRYPGRPRNTDDSRQLLKIEALLTDQRLPWKYAHAIAKRMYGKDRVELCNAAELSAVITALIKRAENHAKTK